MKRLALFVFFALSANAYGACSYHDYSDLHEMGQQELKDQYCANLTISKQIEKSLKAKETESDLKSLKSCKDEIQKIESMYKKSYKTSPVCQ
jgi:hypothetical protein